MTIVGTGLGAVALVAFTATWEPSSRAGVTRDIVRTSDAVGHQRNADTMHEGVRADVMSALLATPPADRRAYGVDDVAEHTRGLLNDFDAAAANAPASMTGRYAAV